MTRDRGHQIGLGLQKRFRYIRETFNDEPRVSSLSWMRQVYPHPEGWTPWLEALQGLVAIKEDESLFSTFQKKGMQRNCGHGLSGFLYERNFGISAILIREILPSTGIPSPSPSDVIFLRMSWWSALLQMGNHAGAGFGCYYSCPVSLEYARYYQQRFNVRDDELTGKDYNYLFYWASIARPQI